MDLVDLVVAEHMHYLLINVPIGYWPRCPSRTAGSGLGLWDSGRYVKVGTMRRTVSAEEVYGSISPEVHEEAAVPESEPNPRGLLAVSQS